MIELSGMSYAYGDRVLLDHIDLTLQPGSFYFLTGPSGAGKTTFLKLCYRDLLPSRGILRLFGQDTASLDRDQVATLRQKIGVVHQDCQFLDHLSLSRNIELPLAVTNRPRQAQDLADLLHWVGLEERSHALPPELSGGERQRAALARAVITAPDLVIADEPTGNVDWEMTQRIMTLLVELNNSGKTVLVATHDLNLIRATKSKVSARVLRISNKTLQVAGADL